ncbi:MAG: histidine phosphatase family protein [Vicinamibacterales bacterium]
MRLLLIRHGESSGNAEARLQGHLDYPLSERGRQESERLAERLASDRIDVLLTSPLLRARETADVIARRIDLPLSEHDVLKERDVGEAAGLTRQEIIARFPDFVQARTEGRTDLNIPGWESDAAFGQRVEQALKLLTNGHDAKTVAAVTHGGMVAQICRVVLRMPIVRPGPFMTTNTGITVLDVQDGEFDTFRMPRIRLVTLNDICHLDGL